MTESGQSHGFSLTIATLSDVGRVRSNNEDSFGSAWLADGSLFVIVADGMGGHEAGEVASGLAVQVVEEVVSHDPERDARERLFSALLEANTAILDEGQRSGTRGMGTTAITAIIRGQEVYVALIGDSRCYHVRRGHMMWRSLDHTRVQMLVDSGEISEEEARVHPEAGMLTRALGHDRMADGRPLEPDVLQTPLWLEPEDALLLCSDGLHDLLEDWEIAQMIAGRAPAEAVTALVETACERGGHDNITVALITAGTYAGAYDPSFVPEWRGAQGAQYAGYAETANGADYDTFDGPEEPTEQAVPHAVAAQYTQSARGVGNTASTGVVNPAAIAAMSGQPQPASNRKLIIGVAVAVGAAVLFLLVAVVLGVVLYTQMG